MVLIVSGSDTSETVEFSKTLDGFGNRDPHMQIIAKPASCLMDFDQLQGFSLDPVLALRPGGSWSIDLLVGCKTHLHVWVLGI